VGGDYQSGTIIKTINGGATWTAQTSGTLNDLHSVYFIDANTGYAVGGSVLTGDGILLKTINGGTSWNSLLSVPKYQLYSVYFTDANTGYAVGGGRYY
jgi:photosystem II stability/assembly factor-like uncharacterized protein